MKAKTEKEQSWKNEYEEAKLIRRGRLSLWTSYCKKQAGKARRVESKRIVANFV